MTNLYVSHPLNGVLLSGTPMPGEDPAPAPFPNPEPYPTPAPDPDQDPDQGPGSVPPLDPQAPLPGDALPPPVRAIVPGRTVVQARFAGPV